VRESVLSHDHNISWTTPPGLKCPSIVEVFHIISDFPSGKVLVRHRYTGRLAVKADQRHSGLDLYGVEPGSFGGIEKINTDRRILLCIAVCDNAPLVFCGGIFVPECHVGNIGGRIVNGAPGDIYNEHPIVVVKLSVEFGYCWGHVVARVLVSVRLLLIGSGFREVIHTPTAIIAALADQGCSATVHTSVCDHQAHAIPRHQGERGAATRLATPAKHAVAQRLVQMRQSATGASKPEVVKRPTHLRFAKFFLSVRRVDSQVVSGSTQESSPKEYAPTTIACQYFSKYFAYIAINFPAGPSKFDSWGVSPAARGPGFARSRATNNVAQLRRATPADQCGGRLQRVCAGRLPNATPGRPGPAGANPSRGSSQRGGVVAGCRGGAEPVVTLASSLSPALASSLRRVGRLRRAFVGGSAPHTPTFRAAGGSGGGSGVRGRAAVRGQGSAGAGAHLVRVVWCATTLRARCNTLHIHVIHCSCLVVQSAKNTGATYEIRTHKTIARIAIPCYIIDVGCARHRSRRRTGHGAES
jgi:hypothetical protein